MSAFTILLLLFGFGYHYVYNFLDGTGAFCTENSALNLSNDGFEVAGNLRKKEFIFDTATDKACISTGVYVRTFKSYNIKVTREGAEWTFLDEPSYMGGQPISHLPWYKGIYMAAMFPLRRTLDRPWGAIVLRVGSKGNEEDFLDRDPPAQSDDIRDDPKEYAIDKFEVLEENVRPKRDGELFIYLNKPIRPLLWFTGWIGNTGTAKVAISYR